MKRLIASLLLVACTAALAEPAQRKLAFEREGVVFTANADGTGLKKITEGDWPDISPDGTKLVINTNEPSEKTPVRYIAVVDLATGKKTTFKDIPSNNCATPRWSPDGKTVAFHIYADNDWHVGVVNADGTGFRYLQKAEPKGRTPNFACWAADGKSFFSHDMETLTQFNLDGGVIKKWKMEDVFAEGSFSSGMHFDMSADGKTLLVDVDMGDGDERKNWDGPAPSVWTFDITATKAVRITKKNHFAWMPCWLGADEMIFLSQAVKENEPSLYRGPVKGDAKFTRIAKNAFAPSAQR